MLLKFFHRAAYSKVDRGLKMSTKPIWYWLAIWQLCPFQYCGNMDDINRSQVATVLVIGRVAPVLNMIINMLYFKNIYQIGV